MQFSGFFGELHFFIIESIKRTNFGETELFIRETSERNSKKKEERREKTAQAGKAETA